MPTIGAVPHVKGVLFADYVRMLRSHKEIDWRRHLVEEDRPLLAARVDPAAWYPMSTFERLGNAILEELAHGQLDMVRLWGQASVDQLCTDQPILLAPNDPVETLNRFRVLRATYFDFEALQIPTLLDDEAELVIGYGMGMPAEEAAAWQTMGFFERLLGRAGAEGITASFLSQSWQGGGRTKIKLSWQSLY